MKARFFLAVVIVLALASLAGSSYYFFTKYQKAQRLLENPTEAAKAETQKLTSQLKKLMAVPEKEDPTIATIIDAAKLKDQPFFAKAKNGDKVILYTKARKAILYRLSENRIIDFAPLTLDTQNTQAVQPQTPPVKIALYNGTKTTGLTQTAEKNLKAKYVDIEVVSKDNAKKRDYEKTIVVDLTGEKKDIASQLAADLKGEVGELPKDEIKPEGVDLLVILTQTF